MKETGPGFLTDGEDAARYPGAEEDPLAYPGPRPPGSFLYLHGRVLSSGSAPEPGAVTGRTAVLAVGSNACPGRLLEKFGRGPEAVIPVLHGRWRGGLPVYLPSFAPYGSLPATYWPYPNIEVDLWATLLDPAQLEVMNRSEGAGAPNERYKLVRVEGAFSLGDGALEPVYAYRGARALDLGKGIVPLAGFALRGNSPPQPPLSQPEVLGRVLDALGHELGADPRVRIRTLGKDGNLRRRLEEELTKRFSIRDQAFDRLPPVPVDVQPVKVV